MHGLRGVCSGAARRDGDIADYSGANVCEVVPGHGMLMAIQACSLPVETHIPLDYFTSGEAVGNYAQIRERCHANPIAAWVVRIGGSFFTLFCPPRAGVPPFSMIYCDYFTCDGSIHGLIKAHRKN
jgi:hypothetical protein